MKDFALDESGDILIESGDLVWIRDKPHIAQKIRQVLGTNLGEWRYNAIEGVDYSAFFAKQIEESRIRETIQNALTEIDENFVLQDCKYDAQTRQLFVRVCAEHQDSIEVYMTMEEGY